MRVVRETEKEEATSSNFDPFFLLDRLSETLGQPKRRKKEMNE
jgi:hypothetical protein